MIVFDDVEIPWENVFFYRHTKAAAFIRATLHRYSIYPYVQRYLRFADFLLGVAYASARSTGVTMHQGVPAAMLAVFQERAAASLGDRLITALAVGLAAGGEVSPVRSAGMVIAGSEPWPVTDLRVDWREDPVGELAGLWARWQPQAESYVCRALRPSEMAG